MRMALVGLACLGAVTAYASDVTYDRGDQVKVQLATGEPASPPVQRIVAVAGDRIRVSNSTVYVNDHAVEGLSRELVATVAEWEPQVIPAGHYLVMGEQKQDDGAVRSGSLVPAKRIVGRVPRTVK